MMTAPTPPLLPDEPFDVRRAFGFLLRQWPTVAGTTSLALALGAGYLLCAPPSYSASILVQVGGESAARVLAPESPPPEQKDAASDEMEVLRSRRVLGAAVDQAGAAIEANPLRTPIVGAALERARWRLAALGMVRAAPPARIELAAFELPPAFEEARFVLSAGARGRYTLAGPALARPLAGEVGQPLRAPVAGGTLVLNVSALDAARGQRFALMRHDRLDTVESLQRKLEVELRGKGANVIGVALEGKDPARLAALLDAIAQAYLRQNSASRASEAAQRAAVIEAELPGLQGQLEAAERRYDAARHGRGTVNAEEETKALLQRSVLAQERIEGLRQRRDQLAARFASGHPDMLVLDDQLRSAEAQLDEIRTAMRRIPQVEQDVLGPERDLKVRTEAYAAMLAAARKLRLESASPLASARLIDRAETPVKPVRPRAAAALPIAVLGGLVLGVLAAWLRQALSNRVTDPFALERQLGLPFSALVPHAPGPGRWRKSTPAQSNQVAESMRRFVAVLGPALRTARNKVVLVTGPTARSGSSFVAAHLAATLAACGSRVLLVDADLARGALAARFGVDPGPGLAALLKGEATPAQAIRPGVRAGLDLLPAGTAPAAMDALAGWPGEPALGELLAALGGAYDTVLVDAAPVLAVPDALTLGRHAGMVFAVVRAGVSSVDEVGETMRQFDQAGQALVGFVFNDARAGRAAGAAQGYRPRRTPPALERTP
jgi:tyrosine-protein kinase Etk/Wzc